MSNTAAHIGDMQCTDKRRFGEQVVDIDATCGEEFWIFFTKDPVTKNASAHFQTPVCRYDT